MFIPETHIAIDEYLLLWKGRSRFKVSITIKQEQYSTKNYMLRERSTANLPDFIDYTGADTVYPEPSITLSKPLDDYTNPLKIVIILSEGLCNAG